MIPEPPLADPDTGFRSGKRRNEVWCDKCGRYYHFSDLLHIDGPGAPHKGAGREVEGWPPEENEK